ncbi:hypothetical protein BSIN_2218 [Burkholderia singularis]|uniref:Uncharacterized protein n=1 Tax=Burkholderia singularis TaxID=1503053 RepID=A0A238H1C4_9BURK|nr:hypothetical protein BSIN_2218 [Burkholderia singularis]
MGTVRRDADATADERCDRRRRRTGTPIGVRLADSRPATAFLAALPAAPSGGM